MSKRQIKAHKGGRKEKYEARLTSEEKARVKAVLDKHGLSFSDWVMIQVEREEKHHE